MYKCKLLLTLNELATCMYTGLESDNEGLNRLLPLGDILEVSACIPEFFLSLWKETHESSAILEGELEY